MTTQGSTPPGATNVSEQSTTTVQAAGGAIFLGETDGPATLKAAIVAYYQKVRGGDPGALPALLGLIVLVLAFSFTTKYFFSVGNLANVPGQAAPVILIAMGLVFVLLIAEIDLAAGTAAGACAGAMALALTHRGDLHSVLHSGTYGGYVALMIAALGVAVWQRVWIAAVLIAFGTVLLLTDVTSNQVMAILLAITTGTAIGVLTGILVARVGIPSFVVTLALFLGWQGVLLLFEGNGASISTLRFDIVNGLVNKNVPLVWGWIIYAVFIGLYGLVTVTRAVRRRAQHLVAEPLMLVGVRLAVLAAAGAAAVYFLNRDRQPGAAVVHGMPWVILVILVLLVALSLLLSKTSFGRYVYAVGGSAEAARRAGIDVQRIRVAVFALSSSLAGFAGVILASQLGGVPSSAGGGNTLLYAVGAAVIGGTSLFGGRGRIRDAVLGGLVITLIPNGLTLHPNLGSAYTYIITGAFLLLAAAVDAASRRRNQA